MKHPFVQEHISLQAYNTFGVPATTRYFFNLEREADLPLLLADKTWSGLPLLVIGGGSNILFTGPFEGLVIRIAIQGISHVQEEGRVIVTAGGGVVWNELVWYCVDRGFAGIENLALIPGTAGAAPVQNIGAYGVELSERFHSCRAFDLEKQEFVVFGKDDCGFSYRDSLFKSGRRGRYIITEVSLMLTTAPDIHTSYGAIQEELAKRGIAEPGIRDVAEVVSYIRVSKLPDPSTVGNAGSFFKNPVIGISQFLELQSRFPDIVSYPAGNERIKLAAGWLIEKCGWKGRSRGAAGTWKNQALVLVNNGGASGSDIYRLSEAIAADVQEMFGIMLEREVNIV